MRYPEQTDTNIGVMECVECAWHCCEQRVLSWSPSCLDPSHLHHVKHTLTVDQ